MIKVLEYIDVLGALIQEYSCPHCCKPLQWEVASARKQLSPYNCLGCMKTIADISKLISNEDWRVLYHLKGENSIKCGSSMIS